MDDDKLTPLEAADRLFEAIGTNDIQGVHFALAAGAKVNARYENTGLTPLHWAAMKPGSVEIARLLIENGAKVNATAAGDGYGYRAPLAMAAEYGNADTAALLIEHKAKVDARDSMKNTPLHTASARGHNDIVQLLIDHGADVNALEHSHSTPLLLTAEHGHPETAKLLLAHGADPTLKDGEGLTALDLVMHRGNVNGELRTILEATSAQTLNNHAGRITKKRDGKGPPQVGG